MDRTPKVTELYRILDKFESGHITIPAYQRDQTAWDQKPDLKQQLLCTLFQGLPIPAIWLMGSLGSGYCELVDGLQRLTTLSSFRRDEWALKIPDLPELYGKRYSDLSSSYHDTFLNYEISYHGLQLDSAYGLGLGETMFRRLNKGQPLSPAETHHGEMSGRERQTVKLFTEILSRYVRASQWDNAKQRMVHEQLALMALIGLGIGWTTGPIKEITVYGMPMRQLGNNPNERARRRASSHLVQLDATALNERLSRFEITCRNLHTVFGERILSSAVTTTSATNQSVVVIRFATFSKIDMPESWWLANREAIIKACREVDTFARPERSHFERAIADLEESLAAILNPSASARSVAQA